MSIFRVSVGIKFLFAGAAVAAAAACNKGVDIEKVPEGTPVTVTREDGGVVQGPLQKADDKTVVVRVGERRKTVPRSEIADVRVDNSSEPPKELPKVAKFRELTVADGTTIDVRTQTALSSNGSTEEQRVSAELANPVLVDGVEVFPAGSPVTGNVSVADASGKVKGLARLGVRFDSIRAGGESYPISVGWSRTAEPTKSSDAKKIGIPAAGGAILGGILGGKKGAVIGGAIGGGAGTGAVLMTSGKEVVLPAGSLLHLRLDRDLDVKVPIK